MNKNYLSVWNELTQSWVAVSEKTKSKGNSKNSKNANKLVKTSSFLQNLKTLTIVGTTLIGGQSAFAIPGCNLLTTDYFKCDGAGIVTPTTLTVDMSQAVSNVLFKDTYIDANITFQDNPGVDYNVTLEKTLVPTEAFPTDEVSSASNFNFGSGNDTLTIKNSSGIAYFVGGTINMGAGNNTVNILGQNADNHIYYYGNINFDSDSGDNTLNLSGNVLLGSAEVNFAFGGQDVVSIRDNAVIGNSTVFKANQGHDSLFVTNGTFDIKGDNFLNFEYFEIGTDSGSSTVSTNVTLLGSALTLDGPNSKIKPAGVVINSDAQLSLGTDLFTLTTGSQIKNFGVINLTTGANPQTLIINGNYIGGANSSIIFKTELIGDASRTSKLIINGDTSGTSKVFVNNYENGKGAKTVIGIPLITVNGTSDAVFTLGAPVQAGSFDYFLNKVGTNWLLQSVSSNCDNCAPKPTPSPTASPTPSPTPTATPAPKIYRPAVAGYLQASQTFFDQNISLLGQFDQRYSNLSLTGNIWGRVIANKGKQTTSTFGYEQSGQVFQFGKDVFNQSNKEQTNINKAGFSAAIGHLNTDYQDKGRRLTKTGEFTGQSNSDSLMLGAYYTRTENNQTYFDIQALASSYKTHFHDVYDGLAKQNSLAFALSAEAGREFAFNNNQLLLTPQMQLAYQKVSAKGFDDSVSSVSKQNADSLRLRAGVQLKPNLKNANLENNLKSKTNWNVSLNLWQELLNSPNRTIAETKVQAQNLNRPWAEVGLGLTHDINENSHFLAQITHQQSWGSNKKSGQSINVNYRFQW